LSGAASIKFFSHLNGPIEDQYAYVVNPLFPDQRIDADAQSIQDAKDIIGHNDHEILKYDLMQRYKEKYSQD